MQLKKLRSNKVKRLIFKTLSYPIVSSGHILRYLMILSRWSLSWLTNRTLTCRSAWKKVYYHHTLQDSVPYGKPWRIISWIFNLPSRSSASLPGSSFYYLGHFNKSRWIDSLNNYCLNSVQIWVETFSTYSVANIKCVRVCIYLCVSRPLRSNISETKGYRA